MGLVNKIESVMPKGMLNTYRSVKRITLYKLQRQLDKKIVAKLSKTERPINVVFFATLSSMWKYDSLYQLIVNDKNFYSTIVVCPFISRGEDFLREEMNRTYNLFKSRNWNVVKGYDIDTDTCINIKSLSPDIIFYTDSNRQHPNFSISKYHNCLTCYLPYGYNTIPYAWYCTSLFHNQLWQFFIECNENAHLIESLSPIKVDNHIVVGYPMYDIFTQKAVRNPWKTTKKLKRIIWAPHSSIGNNLSLVNFSTFLDYSDFMLDLATRLKDKVEIAFKPHPELKTNLYKHPDWGKDRTDAYYAQWAMGENTMIAEGDYVDLFLTSDALIHDCGSFLVEYLYTKKPCLYLTHNGRLAEMNEIGLKAYNTHYHATDALMIEDFITKVVLEEQDRMLKQREEFFHESLLPPNNMSVAENIVRIIKSKLNRK